MRTSRIKRLAPACLLAASLALVSGGVFGATAGAKANGGEALGRHRERDGQHAALPAVQPVVVGLQHEVPRRSPSRRPGPVRARASPTPPTGRPTSVPRTPISRRLMSQATPTLLNIPLAISAQLITYNIPGVTAHLKLTGKLISSIYQGKVTNWNDSAITSLNPGVTLPSLPIVTLHRSDSSGDTFLFSPVPLRTDPSGWGKSARLQHHAHLPQRTRGTGGDGQLGHGGGLQGHPRLYRLRRHQLPDPGPPVGARLRPAAERQQAVRAPARRPASRLKQRPSPRRPRPTGPSRSSTARPRAATRSSTTSTPS